MDRSREALRLEMGRRATSIVTELAEITGRLEAHQSVTPTEVAQVTARIAALRGTIAYCTVLDEAR